MKYFLLCWVHILSIGLLLSTEVDSKSNSNASTKLGSTLLVKVYSKPAANGSIKVGTNSLHLIT